MPHQQFPPDLLPIQPQSTIAFHIARLSFTPIIRFLFRVRITGKENRVAGPCIIIANHLGWFDMFGMIMAFPTEPRIHFLADPVGLSKRRAQWWFIRSIAGYIPVYPDEQRGRALYKVVQAGLEKGAVVALFPEGTYGVKEGSLLPFQRGFAHFARAAQVPIVPVAFWGTKQLWLWKTINVNIGKPIMPEGSIDDIVRAGEAGVARAMRPRRYWGPRVMERTLTSLL